jgi:hypothetical protein
MRDFGWGLISFGLIMSVIGGLQAIHYAKQGGRLQWWHLFAIAPGIGFVLGGLNVLRHHPKDES